MPRHGADGEALGRLLDALEARQAGEVHQNGGLGEALLEGGNKSLAAGDDLRLGIVGQHLHGVGEGRGALELEGIHGATSSYSAARRMARA